jgi:hypothetical protein
LLRLPGPAIGGRRQLKHPGQGLRVSQSFYFWILFSLNFVFFVGNHHLNFVCMLQALSVFATRYTSVCSQLRSISLRLAGTGAVRHLVREPMTMDADEILSTRTAKITFAPVTPSGLRPTIPRCAWASAPNRVSVFWTTSPPLRYAKFNCWSMIETLQIWHGARFKVDVVGHASIVQLNGAVYVPNALYSNSKEAKNLRHQCAL